MEKRILLTCFITKVYCIIWRVLENVMYGQVQHRWEDDIIMLLFIPIIWFALRDIGVRPNILNVQHNDFGEIIEVEWSCPVCGLHSLQEVPHANYCQCCGSKLKFKGELYKC